MSEIRYPRFRRVSIIGVGLIGASFALALRAVGLAESLRGCGRSLQNLQRACDRGIIDDFATDIPSACADADLVLLATPVGAFADTVRQMTGCLAAGTIVSDVGSVKGDLVAEIEGLLSSSVHYVPAHPIAGGETSGIDEARGDLFRNALCIITPTTRTDGAAREKVKGLWERIGARVETMDPFLHDRIYAAVSHFPHVAAYTLVSILSEIDPRYLDYAGGGFRDTTRIALSSPELWRDICMYNRGNLSDLIGRCVDRLVEVRGMIESGDAKALVEEFAKARDFRLRLK